MKKKTQVTKQRSIVTILATALAAIIIFSTLSGCGIADLIPEGVKSELKTFTGRLVGVSFNAEFYDNYGAKFMNASGEKVHIDGNIVEELGVDADGNKTLSYSLSSVITIDIDGKQMQSCGNTVIFEETGLEKDVEFSLSDIESNSNGLSSLTSVSKVVNKYKNFFGKPQVVVIQSQLGVPICAYSGKSVHWDIPDDLPKTTLLTIDGKALYIHRANFEIIDKSLLQ